MKTSTLTIILAIICSLQCSARTAEQDTAFEGYEVTPEGAWCWFADPRALRHVSKDGSIDKTYIGYIDIHGSIKATQIDKKTNRRDDVLIRSWFQPDDHNNPTFLILPDERVMVFYSRHTDEPCFYYRVTSKPGDLTTLGDEKIIKTKNNTTYPSPFILSNDPGHIYLCWRGINWHPTIARLLVPDTAGNTNFDWGPYQMVQSTGARPYAKYTSNGKDKIFMAYTTGHPDNEQPNYVYFNTIDINSLKLKDVKGNELSTIQDGPHRVNKSQEYLTAYPDAVVEHSDFRNWIWEVSVDSLENPCIAMARISPDKNKHDYFRVKWTGGKWEKTFLANAGGHFHQTPDIERCYSGGMAIDKNDDRNIYASVPVNGANRTVYEIVKYSVLENGEVKSEPITWNSKKNNSRPYFIAGAESSPLYLTWMHGDYYDWIVSDLRPKGYCTAIHSIDNLTGNNLPAIPKPTREGRVNSKGATKLISSPMNEFTILLSLNNINKSLNGTELDFGDFIYGVDCRTSKPYLMIDNSFYGSSNVMGNSDAWTRYQRATDGKWLAPEMPSSTTLCITYCDGVLRTYINGLMDQSVPVDDVAISNLHPHFPDGVSANYRIYNRQLSQDEINRICHFHCRP